MEVNGYERASEAESKVAPLEEDCVEIDPTGRYIRYNELLGKGAYKKVYKAFDEVDGIEVAWNKVSIDQMLRTPENLARLYSEVHFLKTLSHDNILKFYNSWVDDHKRTINIITELFTSGSLRMYRKKHKHVDLKAIKNWARQILRGLEYLHSLNPPIIHRDLKCDNIFVNGNHGEVKIGDLGLATMMEHRKAQSVLGTPEFMAPELYEEEYNELVDVYSFGMCMLEMVTVDYPYSECKNAAQIFKRVTTGVKPTALDKVMDLGVKQFIEKCLAPVSDRPSAKELLKDPFLQCISPNDSRILNTPKIPIPVPKSMNSYGESISMDIDLECKSYPASGSTENNNHVEPYYIPVLELERVNKDNEFRLRGERKDVNCVSLVLRITDSDGQGRNIHFLFYLDVDTARSVAIEMVEQLELEDYDVAFIAEFIDFLLTNLVPDWRPPNESAKCSSNISMTSQKPVASKGDSGGSSISVQLPGSGPKSPNGYAMDHTTGEKEPGMQFQKLLNGFNNINNTDDDDNININYNNREGEEELKAEIDMIEAQYKQWFQDLLRMREADLENARKKWLTKKRDANM